MMALAGQTMIHGDLICYCKHKRSNVKVTQKRKTNDVTDKLRLQEHRTAGVNSEV